MGQDYYLLIIVFFLIALLYSSAGFGGGSSYLAILALAGVNFYIMRSTALMCNILVVTGGTVIFIKNRHLDFKDTWPLVVVSVPMAFLGGKWPVTESWFFLLLGVSLLVASILLWIKKRRQKPVTLGNKTVVNIIIGSAIGFLSGLVGIGGGIFLSPILHLMGWGNAKKIAATASFFILVNSISGLLGQYFQYSSQIDLDYAWPLLGAVFVGGQIGSRLAAQRFNPFLIKRITAILIFVVSIRILWDYLIK